MFGCQSGFIGLDEFSVFEPHAAILRDHDSPTHVVKGSAGRAAWAGVSSLFRMTAAYGGLNACAYSDKPCLAYSLTISSTAFD